MSMVSSQISPPILVLHTSICSPPKRAHHFLTKNKVRRLRIGDEPPAVYLQKQKAKQSTKKNEIQSPVTISAGVGNSSITWLVVLLAVGGEGDAQVHRGTVGVGIVQSSMDAAMKVR